MLGREIVIDIPGRSSVVSLESTVQQRIVGRLRPARAGDRDATTTPSVLADPTTTMPGDSMRLLESAMAVAAIVTALLIGVR